MGSSFFIGKSHLLYSNRLSTLKIINLGTLSQVSYSRIGQLYKATAQSSSTSNTVLAHSLYVAFILKILSFNLKIESVCYVLISCFWLSGTLAIAPFYPVGFQDLLKMEDQHYKLFENVTIYLNVVASSLFGYVYTWFIVQLSYSNSFKDNLGL